MMYTPRSRLSILQPSEIDDLVGRSALVAKYAQTFDRESLEMILARRIPPKPQTIKKNQRQKVKTTSPSTLQTVLNSATSREIGRTAAQALTRGFFTKIGATPTLRRRRR